MTVSVCDFSADFTPEENAAVQLRTRLLVEEELTLRDLRQARQLTQEHVARVMGVEQENVSRLERRADLLLSTLSNYVAAMGGRLQLVAAFPDREPIAIALADLAGDDPHPKPKASRGHPSQL